MFIKYQTDFQRAVLLIFKVPRNTKVYKIRKLHMTVFSTFYDILQPNFTVLLNL